MMKVMKRPLWLYDWTENGNKKRHEEEVKLDFKWLTKVFSRPQMMKDGV